MEMQEQGTRIFADYAAGRAIDARVLQEMLPYFGAEYGNPSAAYTEGVRARRALDAARERVAAVLGAHPEEIFFTSGATEADNWAIRGALRSRGGGVVTSRLEHPAVLRCCEACADDGTRVSYADVEENGRVSLDALSRLLRDGSVSLVTMMYANHETGVIQPVGEAASLAHKAGAWLLCDAVQAMATQPIDVGAIGVDLLTVSGHKLGAPRGVGAMYVRRGVKLAPFLQGGGQERGLRSGTESVAMAVGLAKALELCAEAREQNDRVRAMAERLLAALCRIPGVRVNGWQNMSAQLPGTVNLCFDGIMGGALVVWLDRHGVCISAGSACSSRGNHPSQVLLAMGRNEREAMGAVRISLSHWNTEEEIEKITFSVAQGIEVLRSFNLNIPS